MTSTSESSPTQDIYSSSSSPFPSSETEFLPTEDLPPSVTTEELWATTSSTRATGSTTESLEFGSTSSASRKFKETDVWWETSETPETITPYNLETDSKNQDYETSTPTTTPPTTEPFTTTTPTNPSQTETPRLTSSETISFELSSDTPPPTKDLATTSSAVTSEMTPDTTTSSPVTKEMTTDTTTPVTITMDIGEGNTSPSSSYTMSASTGEVTETSASQQSTHTTISEETQTYPISFYTDELSTVTGSVELQLFWCH